MLIWASPHPTAIDWQHRATAKGGSTHNLHRDSADRLCKGLDSTGLTSKMVEVYPFLGDDIPSICTKLLYSAVGSLPYMTSQNWMASHILAFGGLKDAANSTRNINTNFKFSTALAGKESLTGVHWYTRNTAASGSSQVSIGANSVQGGMVCGWVNSGSRESGFIAGNNNYAAGTSVSAIGFHSACNLGVRTTQYFLNGVAMGGVGAVSALSWNAGTSFLFGNPAATPWKRDLLFVAFTVALTTTEVLTHSRVCKQFQQFLNRA